MKLNIRISRFEISRYFVKCDFLTMGFSDGEGLSQLIYSLLMLIRKDWTSCRIKVLSDMEENEKKLSYGYGDKNGKLWLTRPPLKGCSLKIEILTRG